MEYSFQRYLLAKQAIDDRALNRNVLDALRAALPPAPLRMIEVGAGMGNMLARLITWGIVTRGEYVHEDALEANIRFARRWLPEWAGTAGLKTEMAGENDLRLRDAGRDVLVHLEAVEVSEFIAGSPEPADLLIAHAFLDLLPMPESLVALMSLTRNLAWLTINFDGLTSFEPALDRQLDEQIERLYHESMDKRPSGGDSRAGRHLFQHVTSAGARVVAAGPSDWVVFARDGKYPGDEAYFLEFILHFFEEALSGHPDLDPTAFAGWMAARRAQIARGELVYIAHQLDYLVAV